MEERFDDILYEVCNELGLSWWEVYDSEYFDEVNSRIETEYGEAVFETDEYIFWESDLYWNL